MARLTRRRRATPVSEAEPNPATSRAQDADRLRDAGNFAAAAEAYAQALRLAPERTSIRVQLGNMLKDTGRLAEAEAAYRTALAERPDDADTYVQLGRALKGQEQWSAALEAFRRATELDPDSAEAVAEFAGTGDAARVRRGADAQLRAVGGAEPDQVRQAAALIRDADRLRDAGAFAGAADAYAAALALAPGFTGIQAQLGAMLAQSGRAAAAEAAYRAALAAAPDEAALHLQLGRVLRQQGKWADFLGAFRRAADLGSAEAVLELANAGQPPWQRRAFEAQMRAHGVEALLALRMDLDAIRARIDGIVDALPDPKSWTAYPVEAYESFRALFDIPAPPGGAAEPLAFTVLLLADREPLPTLYLQLAAMRAQEYAGWRLAVIGTEPARREAVERAAAAERRIAWVEAEAGDAPAAAEMRAAAEAVRAQRSAAGAQEWLLLLAAGAVPHRHALGWMAAAAALGPAAAFVCDEEAGYARRGRVSFTAPVLRQAVDHDTLLEANVFGETVAVRADRFAAARLATGSVSAARSALLLDLAWRSEVGHIPFPLVWRALRDDAGADASQRQAAHRDAVAAHLAATGLPATIALAPDEAPPPFLPIRWQAGPEKVPIAVIVPTRDNADDVRTMVESLRRTAADGDRLDILVVDNNGGAAARAVLERLAAAGAARLATIAEPFNWARLNNLAVGLVGAPLLVFANDDMRMVTPGWDAQLRGLLRPERPDVGAVGARLLYDDGTLQHAGMILGWRGGGIHDGVHEPASSAGPASRWQVTRTVAAVTGAFLATRRDAFAAAGGFDEAALAVSFNDVDYALKLRRAGLRVLWTPHITLYHHESKSRGLDQLDVGKAARNTAEYEAMAARWGEALEIDPGVHPAWHDATRPFRLLAAPSAARVRRHVARCASGRPWHVDGAASAGPGDAAAPMFG